MELCTEAVDLNNIPHPDESQVAAVRGVWPETPLVYPCVADKQTAYPIWARCRGPPSTQSRRGRPAPLLPYPHPSDRPPVECCAWYSPTALQGCSGTVM